MKRLSLVIVVFLISVLVVGCGGGNESTKVSQIPSGDGDSGTGGLSKDLKVSDKNCSEDLQKITNEDLTEAFVNTVCQFFETKNIYGPDNTKGTVPDGELTFVSLKSHQASDGSLATLDFEVNLAGCSTCPRDFHGLTQFSKNIQGEWQLDQDANILFDESAESRRAAIIREVKITFPTNSGVFSLGKSLDLNPTVEGEPTRIMIQVQLEDGRVLVFSAWESNLRYFSEDSRSVNIADGTKVKILAYTFEKNGVQPDWISLESK